MRVPISSAPPPPAAAILSVSGHERDHAFFDDIGRTDSDWVLCTNAKWDLHRAFSLPSAIVTLQRTPIAVLVCADDLAQGTWKQLLQQVLALPDPPTFVLASNSADERLWMEAIHLGAYDVIVKPLAGREVMRIVASAAVSWLGRHERRKRKLAEQRAVEQWNAAAG
jgi:DNA-binding NtrC family response regulator